jgi:hypothetical protein
MSLSDLTQNDVSKITPVEQTLVDNTNKLTPEQSNVVQTLEQSNVVQTPEQPNNVQTLEQTDVQVTKQPKGTKIDYLTEDKNLPPNQNWVCISFLSPEGIRNCSVRGLKIRGVFKEEADARKYAAELQDADPLFHIFVGEMGKWLPWDPNPDSIKDQNYYEQELQNLMKSYNENKEKAKKAETQRRQETVDKSVADAKKNKKESTRERLKRKLAAKAPKLVDSDTSSTVNTSVTKKVNEELVAKEQLAAKERDRLANNVTKIAQKESEVKALDQSINKIKAIYDNMQKKKTATK